ncbi:MAG TPA: Trm112 family protein [Anaeromyxobacter sp.]|nr:Trm112 family protein [Anaeromyxobacter sp.]
MPVEPDLLEILACPRCKGPMDLDPGGGELLCSACQLAYRIEGDIPVLLVEEARRLEPDPPARVP